MQENVISQANEALIQAYLKIVATDDYTAWCFISAMENSMPFANTSTPLDSPGCFLRSSS